MMVNYLFPLTDKSPAPLRLSWPDSWQVEEGVNVTGGPGTQNGLAMAFQLLPIQTLTSWPRELVRAPTMTWGPPTPSDHAPALSFLPLIMLRKQHHPHEALHQNLSSWPRYFSLPFLIWLNGTIIHPSHLTRNFIITPNTSLFLMSHHPCTHLWACPVV